jgi:hypothetical protein
MSFSHGPWLPNCEHDEQVVLDQLSDTSMWEEQDESLLLIVLVFWLIAKDVVLWLGRDLNLISRSCYAQVSAWQLPITSMKRDKFS